MDDRLILSELKFPGRCPCGSRCRRIEWRAIQTRPLEWLPEELLRRARLAEEEIAARTRAVSEDIGARARAVHQAGHGKRTARRRHSWRVAAAAAGMMARLATLGVGLILANSAVAGTYWIALVPLFGLLCVVTAWARPRRDRSGLSLIVLRSFTGSALPWPWGSTSSPAPCGSRRTWPRA